jgi:hypothetical protein
MLTPLYEREISFLITIKVLYCTASCGQCYNSEVQRRSKIQNFLPFFLIFNPSLLLSSNNIDSARTNDAQTSATTAGHQ